MFKIFILKFIFTNENNKFIIIENMNGIIIIFNKCFINLIFNFFKVKILKILTIIKALISNEIEVPIPAKEGIKKINNGICINIFYVNLETIIYA